MTGDNPSGSATGLSVESNISDSSESSVVAGLLSGQPIKAASFIVTVYGDAVEPRGGVVWIGSLIEVCARVGISATLVRTAVSRLVATGQLVGSKSGKRSFYRLTPCAQIEFALAAQQLFDPKREEGWRFVYLSGSDIENDARQLERHGYGRAGRNLLIGCRPLPPIAGSNATVFNASVEKGEVSLRQFADDFFNLQPLSDAYRAFIARYSRLKGITVPAAEELSLRLLLVHDFRYIVLRDPNFPADALPENWPGSDARQLFSSLYRDWSDKADRLVASVFMNEDGFLKAQTEATHKREGNLLALR